MIVIQTKARTIVTGEEERLRLGQIQCGNEYTVPNRTNGGSLVSVVQFRYTHLRFAERKST